MSKSISPTSASGLPDWDGDGGAGDDGRGGNRPSGDATAGPDAYGRTYHNETLSYETGSHHYNYGYAGSGSNSVTWSTPMVGGSRTTTRSHEITEEGNVSGSWDMYDYDESVNSHAWGESETDRTNHSDAEYTYDRVTGSNYSYSWSNSSGAGNGSGSSHDEFYQEESYDNSSSNRQWESYSYAGYVGNSEQGTESSYTPRADGYASGNGNHNCYRPNYGRTFCRIRAVEILGCWRGFCRIAENVGEGIRGGCDVVDPMGCPRMKKVRSLRLSDHTLVERFGIRSMC